MEQSIKHGQYRPESIRGKRPINQPHNEQQQPVQHIKDDTSIYDMVSAPFQGFINGLLNTGVQTRQQYEYMRQRKRRGLPPARYKKPPWLLSPFRRISSNWLTELIDRE